ncbi:MAG: succinate dehydrogenase, hydrophobic membrane anchor protein [Pseudomonadota bacterium]
MSQMNLEYKTGRKRAIGLGSARGGTHHHWQMLLSSIAMIFAVPALVITFALALGGEHAAVISFLSHPAAALIMGLSLVVAIRHFMFETLEAIEDYIHGIPGRLAIFATTALAYVMIAVGLFALAKIAI